MSKWHDPNEPTREMLENISERYYVRVLDDGKLYSVKTNKSVGHLNKQGYLVASVWARGQNKNVQFKVPHIIWYFRKGEWPKSEIDHKNRTGKDNKISNIRESNRSQNTANRSISNKSYVGVRNYYNKFYARIQHKGKEIHLGIYDTPEEAFEAYKVKYKEIYGTEFER